MITSRVFDTFWTMGQIGLTMVSMCTIGNTFWANDLTLRGLSLFFKILPISNTGVSIANILVTVNFLYPKPGSFPNMDYYFYQLAYRDSKVPKCFVGLNQMQCSLSFDCNWGKQMTQLHVGAQLHPQFQVFQQGKCLRYPPECISANGKPQIA